MLLDDMHLRGATMVELDLAAEGTLEVPASACAVFHIVIEGQTLLRVGAQARPLSRGDVLVLPAGPAHTLGRGPATQTMAFGEADGRLLRLGPAGPGPRLQLLSGQARFDAELARPFMTALPALLHIPGEGGALPPWIAIGLEFIRQELRAELPARQTVVNRMADILFIECLRRYVQGIPDDAQTWLRALLDPALSRALAALHRDPAQPWNVAALARQANLSRSAFAQRFRQCLGQTPMGYLAAHRLRQAAWQLRHSSAPVARIAEDAGYASSSAFTQAFVRRYGQSPRAYRNAPPD